MTKTVLVIGGAGYIGAHCCKAFAKAGWNVVVYDNLSHGWRDFVRWGELIQADILDEDALLAAMQQVKPDAVAHFAALIEVGESVKEPNRYYRTNAFGALNIIEAMRKTGVDKILFSSTCATYGAPQYMPLDEAHPQWPINPYGWTKLFVERMLADASRAHGQHYVSLRYFNAAGADEDGEIGERHEPESHLIPLAIRGARRSDYQFTIFGNDFDTRDGTCIRDYIHVRDLADAHCRALDYLMAGGASDAFNLGTGVGATVLEIARAVERMSGKPLAMKIGPRREGDPPALLAAPEKAQRILGWRAQTGIEEIVRSAWAWHEKDDGRPRAR